MPLSVALGLTGDPRFEDLPGRCRWPTTPAPCWSASAASIAASAAAAALGVHVFTMADIDRLGMRAVMERAIELAAGGAFLHASFDMDVLDPDQAPGVGTPVRGGITYREAHLAMEMLAESGLMSSLELVEVNPILDERNATGSLAVELALSALGARIL